jgi:excisionase family DNA binding protein
MEREFLTVKEVAQWLGVVERTVYRLMDNRAFPFYKIGRSNKFRRCDIETYLESVKQ